MTNNKQKKALTKATGKDNDQRVPPRPPDRTGPCWPPLHGRDKILDVLFYAVLAFIVALGGLWPLWFTIQRLLGIVPPWGE